MTTTKLITGVAKNVASNVDPTAHATKAFENLVSAWKECKIVTEQEKTKRVEIKAFRDINVKAIEENSALLKMYLEYSFKERAFVIQKLFDTLDKSLESGNTQAISDAITGIVDITRQSPLAAAKEIMSNIYNPNVKSIEI